MAQRITHAFIIYVFKKKDRYIILTPFIFANNEYYIIKFYRDGKFPKNNMKIPDKDQKNEAK